MRGDGTASALTSRSPFTYLLSASRTGIAEEQMSSRTVDRYAKAVHLDFEARGEIARLLRAKPLRWRRLR